MQFLQGFVDMRIEFILAYQNRFESSAESLELVREMKGSDDDILHRLSEYNKAVDALIKSSDFVAVGRLAFKVAMLVHTLQELTLVDLRLPEAEAFNTLVQEIMQSVRSFEVPQPDEVIQMGLREIFAFAFVWNPLRLLRVSTTEDDGVCAGDVIAQIVSCNISTLAQSLEWLATAVFMGVGYAELPYLVRQITQILSEGDQVDEQNTNDRLSLRLKTEGHYLKKIVDVLSKYLRDTKISTSENSFYTFRSMARMMKEAFYAKLRQASPGGDVIVKFQVLLSKAQHVAFAQLQRLNHHCRLLSLILILK